MVARVARHLGVEPDHIYCIGDNRNDLPMLACSAIPFAPANCDERLRQWGARVLVHCDRHAVAQAIEILDKLY
jgi:hydroxymethylpyrimidine pyrophosphatase-like HAD family hydrolase